MPIPKWKWGTETDIVTDIGKGDVSDISAGEIVSEVAPDPQISKPPAIKIISPIPLPIIGQFPTVTVGDGVDFGLLPIQEVIFAEPEPEEIIVYPSPFIPIAPEIGEDVPPEYAAPFIEDPAIATPFPIVEPIALPEIPDVFGGLKDIFGTLSKWVLPVAVVIGAYFFTRQI